MSTRSPMSARKSAQGGLSAVSGYYDSSAITPPCTPPSARKTPRHSRSPLSPFVNVMAAKENESNTPARAGKAPDVDRAARKYVGRLQRQLASALEEMARGMEAGMESERAHLALIQRQVDAQATRLHRTAEALQSRMEEQGQALADAMEMLRAATAMLQSAMTEAQGKRDQQAANTWSHRIRAALAFAHPARIFASCAPSRRNQGAYEPHHDDPAPQPTPSRLSGLFPPPLTAMAHLPSANASPAVELSASRSSGSRAPLPTPADGVASAAASHVAPLFSRAGAAHLRRAMADLWDAASTPQAAAPDSSDESAPLTSPPTFAGQVPDAPGDEAQGPSHARAEGQLMGLYVGLEESPLDLHRNLGGPGEGDAAEEAGERGGEPATPTGGASGAEEGAGQGWEKPPAGIVSARLAELTQQGALTPVAPAPGGYVSDGGRTHIIARPATRAR